MNVGGVGRWSNKWSVKLFPVRGWSSSSSTLYGFKRFRAFVEWSACHTILHWRGWSMANHKLHAFCYQQSLQQFNIDHSIREINTCDIYTFLLLLKYRIQKGNGYSNMSRVQYIQYLWMVLWGLLTTKTSPFSQQETWGTLSIYPEWTNNKYYKGTVEWRL